MSEQRLIDANAMCDDWLEHGENEYVYDTNSVLYSIDDQPTIDPETLPIVRQLREELAKVAAERDMAVSDLNFIGHCGVCKTKCSLIDAIDRKADGECAFFEWRGPQKEK